MIYAPSFRAPVEARTGPSPCLLPSHRYVARAHPHISHAQTHTPTPITPITARRTAPFYSSPFPFFSSPPSLPFLFFSPFCKAITIYFILHARYQSTACPTTSRLVCTCFSSTQTLASAVFPTSLHLRLVYSYSIPFARSSSRNLRFSITAHCTSPCLSDFTHR